MQAASPLEAGNTIDNSKVEKEAEPISASWA